MNKQVCNRFCGIDDHKQTTSSNAFAQLTGSLLSNRVTEHKDHSISQSDYNAWCQEFSFEALKNQRYGQSFCVTFNITDNILFYERDVDRADQYIKKTYLTI